LKHSSELSNSSPVTPKLHRTVHVASDPILIKEDDLDVTPVKQAVTKSRATDRLTSDTSLDTILQDSGHSAKRLKQSPGTDPLLFSSPTKDRTLSRSSQYPVLIQSDDESDDDLIATLATKSSRFLI
jgi:hypothetical protein